MNFQIIFFFVKLKIILTIRILLLKFVLKNKIKYFYYLIVSNVRRANYI